MCLISTGKMDWNQTWTVTLLCWLCMVKQETWSHYEGELTQFTYMYKINWEPFQAMQPCSPTFIVSTPQFTSVTAQKESCCNKTTNMKLSLSSTYMYTPYSQMADTREKTGA